MDALAPARARAGFLVGAWIAIGAGFLASAGALSGCARGAPAGGSPEARHVDGLDDLPAHAHTLAGYEAHFVLTWNGARIGDAVETLRRRPSGLRFERRERISLRRGGQLVHTQTAIAIDTDASLRAEHISIWQISGDAEVRGRAVRDPRGAGRGSWIATWGDEPARRLPAGAVPAELVPLLAASGRGAHRFDGTVILAGYGFATARLRVSAPDAHTLLAELETAQGRLRGRYALTQAGTVARVYGGDGVGAMRAGAATLAEPFEPPEVVDTSSVLIAGAGEPGDGVPGEPESFVLGPVERTLPPPLPGQHIELDADTWRVRLHAGDHAAPSAAAGALAGEHGWPAAGSPGSVDPTLSRLARAIVAHSNARGPRAEIGALARATATLLQDDLGAPVTGARAALALGRGDCTAHAALFAGLARARGIPARLVTGYRVDGARLVRHRWAIAAADGVWMAVDPTFGEAPAAPRLLGLAVHDTTAADMAMADEIAFAGLRRARARALR